jgi:MFS transporter, DHA1 family, tetracycline resistance protein
VKITDVFLTLWEASKRPLVLKISAVFFCSQLALNSFFVFLDDYLESRFGFDTLQNSIVLIIFGIAIAVTGAVIVAPITKHFPKQRIIYGSLFAMAAGLALFIFNPIAFLSYFLIVPFVVAWAVNYPVMLTLFSGSVGPSEQGWVMGVTVALYTLGAGIISMVGGHFMAIDRNLPFLVAIATVSLAAVLVFTLWRGKAFRDLVD